ncbi:ABC-type sugar transport system ATPase subunit [Halanaerobacter jeridensis]|uniref:ABC-type sugar transport system ATPase subunit n=1 Tax=Halanaerobacter jeridensis TaxID=706427 RepID=A0A939BP90_9FIRM|nr:ABC-type sugar transport system ATPase subunit [Halanaerobacter jeridensis]
MIELSEVMLEMKDIIKDFPGVRALDHVNLKAYKGEVLALVGENGAGKSTLMKVLSGVHPASTHEGEIYIKGERKKFANTKEAESAGVAIIHQELNLIPGMSVAENIFLDRQYTNGPSINWGKLYNETEKVLARLNIYDIEPTDLIKDLTVGKQQMIEIAKALSLNAEILVLDEPTSALTDSEVDELFRVINELKEQGVCMVFISHKMEEIEQIADRVAVLRDGKSIGDITKIEDITLDGIITRMVGDEVDEMFPKEKFERGEKTLEVRDLEVDHPLREGEKKVKGVSFEAYKGEILGIAGLMGSGRTELVSGIFGAYPDDTHGEVYIRGDKVEINSPEEAVEHGIGLIPEDRKEIGLLLTRNVVDNVSAASLSKFSTMGVMNEQEERKNTREYVDQLSIKTPSIDANVATLSGGNQQKVVIGKWLTTDPDILILDEPTRGIDVGAKVEIHRLMNKLVEQGVTVIMISSELPEVLGMSDRVLVMCEGEAVATLDRAEATKEKVMEYASGNF